GRLHRPALLGIETGEVGRRRGGRARPCGERAGAGRVGEIVGAGRRALCGYASHRSDHGPKGERRRVSRTPAGLGWEARSPYIRSMMTGEARMPRKIVLLLPALAVGAAV